MAFRRKINHETRGPKLPLRAQAIDSRLLLELGSGLRAFLRIAVTGARRRKAISFEQSDTLGHFQELYELFRLLLVFRAAQDHASLLQWQIFLLRNHETLSLGF